LRQTIQKFNKWAVKYSQNIDFVVVYIAEAHASDAWPLGKFVNIPNHTCVADRKKASTVLRDQGLSSSIPIYLDSMENTFDKEFAVWPERYYIVHNGVLEYVAEPTHEYGYNRRDLAYSLLMVSNKIQAALDAKNGAIVVQPPDQQTSATQ